MNIKYLCFQNKAPIKPTKKINFQCALLYIALIHNIYVFLSVSYFLKIDFFFQQELLSTGIYLGQFLRDFSIRCESNEKLNDIYWCFLP